MDRILTRVPLEDSYAAAKNIEGYAVRTPLVKLNYRRPDAPQMEIYLKLETLQPINSFKVRGAANAITSVDPKRLKEEFNNTIVSASAGNMGQGVAYAAKSLGCECIVVVPDSAPITKLQAMEVDHGARLIKVPFERWWEVLMTGDALQEIGKKHLFIHPVCDPKVVAGNSTVALEIIEDLPEVDAVLCSWGGGGICSGIGSVLKNKSGESAKQVDMISVEPATAAPLCLSFNNNKTLTPLEDWQASWVDGCGGKSVLAPMWELAKDVLSHAVKVELEAIERSVKVLVEKNRIVAEGAGACPVAAALFGPLENLKDYKKVVAVVCGGCIDTKVLTDILSKDFSSPYILPT
ncbi:hypothetical protein CYMTET_26805 [Cymbomonas tetramitiformis]|uniref:Tryptophan synthase beta chain-like PALP domain-containing protein n=1 Tax=Cymbomonas tetramitiformis TaxID=36881 RepID=A0AAE0KXJ7_9CHLO|nr:hypothetical protein CYMTET_26805 [Cymbomonas tetramitiformis]|eukprot:gene5540-6719_t